MIRNIWIGIVVVILLVAGGWWYLNQSSAPATQQNTTNGTQPVVNNQSSQPALVMKEKLLLLEAQFEGYDRLYYKFSYPESAFVIITSPDNRKVTIKEIATGKIDTISISYEGGRGYTPQDYWNYSLKQSCTSCQSVANPISVKDAVGLATFANQDKEWIVFSGPSAIGGEAWLFVAELQKPAIEVEKIISTFTFVAAK